jgi:hypothetical protein
MHSFFDSYDTDRDREREDAMVPGFVMSCGERVSATTLKMPNRGGLQEASFIPKPGRWGEVKFLLRRRSGAGEKSCHDRRRLTPMAIVPLYLLSLFVGQPVQADEQLTIVASGLVNPRGFAFDEDGELTVAVAGTANMDAGVVKIADGCPAPVVTGLPSYRIVFSAPTGVADVANLDGEHYFLLAGGDIDRGNTPNGLYRYDDRGEIQLVADVSTYIRDNPVAAKPRDFDTDGQPYALLAVGDAFWATEGNSNQLLRLGLDGSITRIADLSAGHPIPTGIAPAPDGGAYVSFLTPIPYTEGASRVIHVTPEGAMHDVWTGLSLVTALAVDSDGRLYALEMATGFSPDDPGSIRPATGRVVRQAGPDTSEEVITGLTFPIAMEFGTDGALYVSTPGFGADNGEGEIVRFVIDNEADATISMPTDGTIAPRCS